MKRQKQKPRLISATAGPAELIDIFKHLPFDDPLRVKFREEQKKFAQEQKAHAVPAEQNKAAKPRFKVERAYLGEVSDTDGRSCSAEEYTTLGVPLMNLIPGVVGTYTYPQIVEFAKTLQACGCDFAKLAEQTEMK